MNLRLYQHLVCLILLIAGTSFCSQGWADIYAVVVADTMSPTGSAAEMDLERIRQELGTISRHTGLKVHLTAFADRDVTIETVSATVNSLPITHDDVALFYYLGHGFRTSGKSTVWPYMYLCNDHKGIDLSVVIEALIVKKPRMALIVADCCNNVMDDESSCPWETTLKVSRYGISPAPGYRALFLQFDGIIVACASKAGEYAYCHERGHIYTSALWRALREEVIASNPNWGSLMERVTRKVGNLQVPYYEILCYP
jgi:hypothetical protein